VAVDVEPVERRRCLSPRSRRSVRWCHEARSDGVASYSGCMPETSGSYDRMVTALVPSLSRSLAEQFNVFRVMHHGTHEKQLSNVFSWLLQDDATHGFEDAFQRLFVRQVNSGLSAAEQLPPHGYRVVQEVDTSGHDALGRDIADIVLTNARASIVVENYHSSDGHGHDFHRYLAHGAEGGKQSVVVLLCARRESHRQRHGWEQAVVVTYAELLQSLKAHVAGDPAWRRRHPQQRFFLDEMFDHFLEGPSAMSSKDRIAFMKAMCDTGESARYGQRPQDAAAQEFSELMAQHARRQFEDGRTTLAEIKRALKRWATHTLVGQVEGIASVRTRFVGQWEWCVELTRSDSEQTVFLEFGPTAVVENARAPEPIADPNYTKVFVTRKALDHDGIDMIVQTSVGLDEVLEGLAEDDIRLRDGVLDVFRGGRT
jgi:hypothetical protein